MREAEELRSAEAAEAEMRRTTEEAREAERKAEARRQAAKALEDAEALKAAEARAAMLAQVEIEALALVAAKTAAVKAAAAAEVARTASDVLHYDPPPAGFGEQSTLVQMRNDHDARTHRHSLDRKAAPGRAERGGEEGREGDDSDDDMWSSIEADRAARAARTSALLGKPHLSELASQIEEEHGWTRPQLRRRDPNGRTRGAERAQNGWPSEEVPPKPNPPALAPPPSPTTRRPPSVLKPLESASFASAGSSIHGDSPSFPPSPAHAELDATGLPSFAAAPAPPGPPVAPWNVSATLSRSIPYELYQMQPVAPAPFSFARTPGRVEMALQPNGGGSRLPAVGSRRGASACDGQSTAAAAPAAATSKRRADTDAGGRPTTASPTAGMADSAPSSPRSPRRKSTMRPPGSPGVQVGSESPSPTSPRNQGSLARRQSTRAPPASAPGAVTVPLKPQPPATSAGPSSIGGWLGRSRALDSERVLPTSSAY